MLIKSILSTAITIYIFLIIAGAVMTWIPNRTRSVEKIQTVLDEIVAPVINLFRRFIPVVYGLDFSSMAAILALHFLRDLVNRIL